MLHWVQGLVRASSGHSMAAAKTKTRAGGRQKGGQGNLWRVSADMAFHGAQMSSSAFSVCLRSSLKGGITSPDARVLFKVPSSCRPLLLGHLQGPTEEADLLLL
jgi:hypothetical protein